MRFIFLANICIKRCQGLLYNIFKRLPEALAIGNFSSSHAITYGDELTVNVFHTRIDGIPDSLLDLLLDEGGSKTLIQEIVF